MRVCGREAVLLQNRPTELIVKADHFVEQLRVLNMVALLIAVVRETARDHLLVGDVLEVQELALVLILLVVEALARIGSLGEEAGLARDGGAIGRAGGRRGRVRRDTVPLVLQLLQLGEELVEELLALVLLLDGLDDGHGALTVDEVCGAYRAQKNSPLRTRGK